MAGYPVHRRVLRVVRRECRTSPSANCGRWHAPPVSVSAMLTLAPGCSPWRFRPALAALWLPSRTVAAGPARGAQVAFDMHSDHEFLGCRSWRAAMVVMRAMVEPARLATPGTAAYRMSRQQCIGGEG